MIEKISVLVMLVVLVVSYAYFIQKGKGPNPAQIRRIPALDAVDEAVARAVEMERPVLCIPGWGRILDLEMFPESMAGISTLNYVARLTARYGAELISTIRFPAMLPYAEDTVEQAYIAEGKRDEFKRSEMVRYITSDQVPYYTHVMGLVARERPAASIMIGYFSGGVMQICEPGRSVGSLQIGGCASNVAILPYFIITCDYVLMSEEVYAAGAYLTKDPEMMAGTVCGDVNKLIAIILLLIGTLFAYVRNDLLFELLRM